MGRRLPADLACVHPTKHFIYYTLPFTQVQQLFIHCMSVPPVSVKSASTNVVHSLSNLATEQRLTTTGDTAVWTHVTVLGIVAVCSIYGPMLAVNLRTILLQPTNSQCDKIELPYSVWLVHRCFTSQQLFHHSALTFPRSNHYWWPNGLHTHKCKEIY